MRGKSVALLGLALGCGLIASIGITQVMAKRNVEPEPVPGETETVFVALEDVGFGEPLSAEALRLEQWPKDKVPTGAMTKLEDIEGRRTRTRLYAGEPILDNKLFDKNSADWGVSGRIPKGYRVVSVRVDKVSGSGLILPGDRVDVLLYLDRNPCKGILKTTTKTILQDVKVFAVNDLVDTEQQGETTIRATTISLLVTPAHAEKIMMATELGRIRLVMRSPEDDDIAEVQGTGPEELLGYTAGSDREAEASFDKPAAPDAPPEGNGFLDLLSRIRNQKTADPASCAITPGTAAAPEGERHEMRIARGDQVEVIVLEADGPGDAGSAFWRPSTFGGGSSVSPTPMPMQPLPSTGQPGPDQGAEPEPEPETEPQEQD